MWLPKHGSRETLSGRFTLLVAVGLSDVNNGPKAISFRWYKLH